MFRLRPCGVDCDEEGLRVADFPLLTRTEGGVWNPRSEAEIERDLAAIYRAPILALAKLGGLAAVAQALNEKNIARAQVAALLLKLPDPPVAGEEDGLRKLNALFEAGWIGKDWDPEKHPRAGGPPNSGWFAPTDGGGAAPTSGPRPRPSADGANSLPIVLVAGGEEEERSPLEEREEEEGATYFNPITGRTVTLQPGSGVALGGP